MTLGSRTTRSGFDALTSVTTLLQRARLAHPTAGLWEAADFQWWWRAERHSDAYPQTFWLDDEGSPIAAAMITSWTSHVALTPLAIPSIGDDDRIVITACGLDQAAAAGVETLEVEVDEHDDALRTFLEECGFAVDPSEAYAESWLSALDRPVVSPLAAGYRLRRRIDDSGPHHNVNKQPEFERRLGETSLYRPDLDLVVRTDDGEVAAYGLFWLDPATGIGMVEPMRTIDAHQRRGLARHVLTAGIDALVVAGAERIKICWELDNPAAGDLYRSVGFEPVRQTVVLRGPVMGAVVDHRPG
ncbi:MAG: GNAT family N-acetyltransferase [Actinomycetota bacterium]